MKITSWPRSENLRRIWLKIGSDFVEKGVAAWRWWSGAEN